MGTEDGTFQTIKSHLANKHENCQGGAEHWEEVIKFHKKWGDEKIKRIKELETEVTKLKKENQHLKEQQNG